MNKSKKAIVLKAPGTNNDMETRFALEEAGALAETVHVNSFAQRPGMLEDAGILVIPGGFPYGDYLGAGRVLAIFLKYRVMNEITKFIKKGKLLMGVCSGFQVLVKSGILPGKDFENRATLTYNDSGRFICRWVRLKVDSSFFWFEKMPEEIELPVAHGEGKFKGAQESAKGLIKSGRVPVKYIDNPNGSELDIAGITSSGGNVLGLMPHPERYLYDFQHPARGSRDVKVWGRLMYRNIVKNA